MEKSSETDYNRFERTVNYMLTEATLKILGKAKLKLATDAGSRVAITSTSITEKVKKETRDNG